MKTKFNSKLANDMIVIVSTCEDSWGGSEELWSRSIAFFQSKGLQVTVFKKKIPQEHYQFDLLHEQGVQLKSLLPAEGRKKGLFRQFGSVFSTNKSADGAGGDKKRPWFLQAEDVDNFEAEIKNLRPRLVIISQAINFDGLAYGHVCNIYNIPYVIVCHKAVDFYWPEPGDRPAMRRVFQDARACYFVSTHNKRLTEEQFGLRLPHGEVIFNPLKVSKKIPFPDSHTTGWKLCCIGRLFVLDKGQDMLLRVLSKPKWKKRPLHVSFVGSGRDEVGLKEMANLLELTNVSFLGQVQDIEAVWKHHHALILPSRSEGLPLTIVEAMKVGRPIITTDAGGSAELLEDGVNGFIAQSNEDSIDSTLERAWARREDWETLGANASNHVASVLPEVPERDFVDNLLTFI
ncbi:glycosyltransferase family 4 protein [Parapedobacter soli]|uniref:glycosyltransferase family 4 protein n=1 Tax=Parapedobacter soli TaxID=416955 RepID=UPI0021C7C446|nr:glycosyltransferase family 4 protein [Parapedobacter soli]